MRETNLEPLKYWVKHRFLVTTVWDGGKYQEWEEPTGERTALEVQHEISRNYPLARVREKLIYEQRTEVPEYSY